MTGTTTEGDLEQKDRLELYEKLYVQEVERREKVSARLNVPLAIFITIIGFMATMLQNLSPIITGFLQVLFWLLFAAAGVTLLFAFWFFSKSWFGHTDQLMPTAVEIETYHQELLDYYAKDKDEAESQFMGFLTDGYQIYATNNAINNDVRSYNLYRATVSITIAACLVFAASIPFYLAPKPKTQNQLIQEIVKMTEQQRKQPPVPPGPRNVKGDVPIPKRPSKEPQTPKIEKKS